MRKRLVTVLLILCFATVFLMTGCNALKDTFFSPQDKQKEEQGGENQNQDSIRRDEKGQSDFEEYEEPVAEDIPQNQGKKIMVDLYFANSDNSAIPSEKREVVVKDGALMRAMLEALIEGPETKGLRKTIPEGTRILGLKRVDDTAVVDFSREFATLNDVAGIVGRASVVNTLTSIDGIEKVRILVEGKDLIGPSGEPFGDMTRFDVDPNGYPAHGEKKTITLYFGNQDASAVVAEKREVAVNDSDILEKIIFEELKKGPKQKGLQPVIPTGSSLLSFSTRNGICTLNLSQQFVDNHKGGSAGESMTIYSIVNSLTELPSIDKVQFMINGKRREVFIHHYFLDPIERNESIIEK